MRLEASNLSLPAIVFKERPGEPLRLVPFSMSKRKRATTPEPANNSDGTLSLTAYEAEVVSNTPHLAVALEQRTRSGESQAGLICMDEDIC